VGSGLKTGRRIFYLKVEKVEEGKRKRGLLKTYSTSLRGLYNSSCIHCYNRVRTLGSCHPESTTREIGVIFEAGKDTVARALWGQ
jgi:hypothetical protein